MLSLTVTRGCNGESYNCFVLLFVFVQPGCDPTVLQK